MLLKRLAMIVGVVTLLYGFAQAAPEAKKTATVIEKAPEIFVEMQTTLGTIVLELNSEKAPNTVGNFIQYVIDKHFDGVIFHRVIPGFMIQGGGFDHEMVQKTTRTPIDSESQNGLKNLKGSIAMARTSDPNSATSQFFINTVNNASLDYPGSDGHGYTVFGRVIAGMNVVEKIEKAETGDKMGHQNVPITPIVIEKVVLIEKTSSKDKPAPAATKK